ncbi:MAG: histidinol-phosphatase HisJ family protein [Saccharofermentans sp.]|nr:histidinol-phosphatase HisJ family protein [Saccharofermentans sp.]
MYTDTHNHTIHYSSDAKMTIDELINSCINKGVSRVAITEHYDLDYPCKDETFDFDLNNYGENFKLWKEKSSKLNGPELLMGIEIGWQEHLKDRIEATASSLPFDQIILSEHVFNGKDVYFLTNLKDLSAKERQSKYIYNLAYMANQINNYNIIAHYDYIDRYLPASIAGVYYDNCPEEFDYLFETIIKKDKALEINTGSIEKNIQKGLSNPMPDINIIKRYIELGGKLITLGSDSHTTDTLCKYFIETANYLNSLGVEAICYFKNGIPQFESITNL